MQNNFTVAHTARIYKSQDTSRQRVMVLKWHYGTSSPELSWEQVVERVYCSLVYSCNISATGDQLKIKCCVKGAKTLQASISFRQQKLNLTKYASWCHKQKYKSSCQGQMSPKSNHFLDNTIHTPTQFPLNFKNEIPWTLPTKLHQS